MGVGGGGGGGSPSHLQTIEEVVDEVALSDMIRFHAQSERVQRTHSQCIGGISQLLMEMNY